MHNIVKITTRISILDLLCPHTCMGCGRTGWLVCGRCKKYIFRAPLLICPECRNIKKECKCKHFEHIVICSYREGLLKRLLVDYKYKSVKDTALLFAQVMGAAMRSEMGLEDVVVVPLPTINRHIRERGFGHMELIGKHLARLLGLRYEEVLKRVNKTVQVGATSEERIKQASCAYEACGVDCDKHYLLIDDVWTTGASMLAAREALLKAGAKHVSMCVLMIGRRK